jgi:enoyl-CoA hydratase/carnithine racemase
MPGKVIIHRKNSVAWVTLEHVGKLNAMSCAMWRALKEAFEGFQSDPLVRCVVVRGADGSFCAGGDIAEYPDFRFDLAQLEAFHEDTVWGALSAMLACDVPLVAQISGACMGAGLEIASCCDIRIADSTARFGAPIARLGFPMAPREAALVSGAVGDATARAMLLCAEVVDATSMAQRGFLMQVLAPDQLPQQALALAQRVATLAPQAARMNKQTLRGLRGNFKQNRPLAPVGYAQVAMKNIAPEAPRSAADTQADPYAYAASAEHREGISAFLEKRKPHF